METKLGRDAGTAPIGLGITAAAGLPSDLRYNHAPDIVQSRDFTITAKGVCNVCVCASVVSVVRVCMFVSLPLCLCTRVQTYSVKHVRRRLQQHALPGTQRASRGGLLEARYAQPDGTNNSHPPHMHDADRAGTRADSTYCAEPCLSFAFRVCIQHIRQTARVRRPSHRLKPDPLN